VVIEAVVENMDLKRQVYKDLDQLTEKDAILASNTSGLSITEIASVTKKPGKVIGMHFFNPAHVMKLVEVIPGLDTTQETIDDVVMFAESLRKLPVIVQECPGFLVNRLFMAYLNEAAFCLEEHAATATAMDAAIVEWGMPMGPFTLMDMLGIDVCKYTGDYMAQEYGPRMAAGTLFEKMVAAGRLGEKTGKGFYGYGDETDEGTQQILATYDRDPNSVFSVERVMYPLINEAVLCLQEHISSLNDIDMAAIAGMGMTYHGERKGPLAIADEIGLDALLEALDKFQAQYGERFRPARLLRTKVRAGHLGAKVGRGFHEYA
jgi:3-hydroxyacyl-CoA dehydrogenase/enoyl-CoA hydratase/3-hydroxybutyryl-CoA epimerase